MSIGKHWITTLLMVTALGTNAEQDDSNAQNAPAPAGTISSIADMPTEPVDNLDQPKPTTEPTTADIAEAGSAVSDGEETANREPEDPNDVQVIAQTEQEASAPPTESATAAAAAQSGETGDTTPIIETAGEPSSTGETTVSEQAAKAKKPPSTTVRKSATVADTSAAMDMSQVIALLQQQQKDIAEQRKLLEAQAQQINGLQEELDVLRAPAPTMSGETVVAAKEPSETLPTSEKTVAVLDGTKAEIEQSEDERDKKAGEAVTKAQTDDPTRDLLTQFPGAWRLPGTSAALAIGGYVKTSVVYNFDPLEIRDRFIVGSIPVGDTTDIEAQSSITASQSRLNFDLREPTEYGLLRAFIEGDFASEDDTFRMRHAFGQWKKVLAGKTWSAFVDTEATPEEVDFEGLNGRISLRQSQVRIMPTLGKNYEFQLSLEDPNPEIQNGQGVTRAPDMVASGRFQLLDRLHVKLALLGRQIRGQRSEDMGGGLDKKYAWGSTLSGRFMTPKFDDRDSLLFQLNMGNGIGRYVNDLASVGNFDGVFNPETGDLKLFDILAGYVSWQHWWKGTVRSNFTLGTVDVSNPNFVEGSAYKNTVRLSTNVFWTPTPRIDIGAEYLWGKRENENGDNDNATQFQMAARYRF